MSNLNNLVDCRKRIILPVVYPTVTSWTWHADLLSIVEGLPEAQDWIYSNYIQVQCRPDVAGEEKLFFEFFPFYRSFQDCPVLHTQYIDRKFVMDKWRDIEEFLIYCIENNYYIYAICNERYMLYLDRDFYHELFVYGYDCEERVFYCADFTFSQSGKYSFKKVPFELVCRGFVDVTEDTDYLLRWEGGILLTKIRLQKENKYNLDLNYIKRNFQEYLEGVNSFTHFGLFYNQKVMSQGARGEPFAYHTFGINVYNTLSGYLNGVSDPQKIDLRPFHNMYEHKKLMKKRIDYFAANGVIGIDRRNKIYWEMERKSLILCNMVIKYKIKGNKEMQSQLINSLYAIKDMEERAMTFLVKQIK